MQYLSAFNARANRLMEGCIIVIFGAMTVIIFMQVLFRYVFEESLSWSEELARYLFIWLTFLGASVAMQEGAHIRVGEIVELVKNKAARKALSLLADLAQIIFLYILMAKSLIVAFRIISLGQISPTMEWLPIGAIYFALPIGCFLMILIVLERAGTLLLSTTSQD